MKEFFNLLGILILCLLSSCSVIVGIFKAGMGFGVFITVLLILVIALGVWRMWKGRK